MSEPPAARPRHPGESGRIRLDPRFRGVLKDAGSWPVDGPFATALVPEALEDLHAAVLAKTPDVKVPRLATRVHRGVVQLVRVDTERAAKRAARGWLPEPQPFTGAFWQRQLRLWSALFLALDAHGADGSVYERGGRLVASVRVGKTTVHLDLVPVGKVRKERYAGYGAAGVGPSRINAAAPDRRDRGGECRLGGRTRLAARARAPRGGGGRDHGWRGGVPAGAARAPRLAAADRGDG